MRRLLVVLIACAGPDMAPPAAPALPMTRGAPDAAATRPGSGLAEAGFAIGTEADSDVMPRAADAVSQIASMAPVTSLAALTAIARPRVEGAEVWLKGATHVHGRASGDSSEPYANVIAWYEQHQYDFIVITDHNRVSELDATSNTAGQVTLRDPGAGLIVFSGVELTHNPIGCLPAGDPSGNCRIHVNLVGPTARPAGRLEWAERRSHARIDMYGAALAAQEALGGLAQLNHPQWLWGMTPELLVELAGRGVALFEIANAAFSRWNAGDATHLSTDALWDAALVRGATIWGTASDDAHDYDGHGKYPPGGGWIVVRARRDPLSILEALASGRFYASTGVVLEHASAVGDQLVVVVDPVAPGRYTIDFIENGRLVDSIAGKVARRFVPSAGYLRAIVTRDDGKRAWVQPVRR